MYRAKEQQCRADAFDGVGGKTAGRVGEDLALQSQSKWRVKWAERHA